LCVGARAILSIGAIAQVLRPSGVVSTRIDAHTWLTANSSMIGSRHLVHHAVSENRAAFPALVRKFLVTGV
jgi:hypothetical protein